MATVLTRWQHLLTQRPALLDGATGTELERRGYHGRLPLWSAGALVTDAELVTAVHRDYAQAGVDIIVANTFRTNPRTLERSGNAALGPALAQLAVALARQACEGVGCRAFVAASVAPVEDCYQPERTPPARRLRREHSRFLDWLLTAQPDLLWIETVGTVREAAVLAELAAQRDVPAAFSFVTNEAGDMLSGEPLADAVAAVTPAAPLALGLNCIPPRGITALLPRLRDLTNCPLAVYAHIGHHRPLPGWSYAQALTPAEYRACAEQWLAAGARIVGGCCGTTPAHIQALRTLIHQQPGGDAPRS